MNLDVIIYNVLIPLLKYPLAVVLPIKGISASTKYICVLYTVCLQIFLSYNHRTKTKSTLQWIDPTPIKDNVIVVSGGSGGLGQALLSRVLERFPSSIIVDIDITPPAIENKRVKFYKCDMSNPEELSKVLVLIKEQFGNHIGCIINNAGIRLPFTKMRDLQDEDVAKIFQINCFAALKVIQELSPNNEDNRQCYVVTVASILGILNASKVSAYAASKAALISFHQSFEHELRSEHTSRIRTLLVLPGQLNTKMFGGFEPPRQFWAPTVDVNELAKEIAEKYKYGVRGTLYKPFYAYFAHLLMSLPICVQILVRKLSLIDDCLPDESVGAIEEQSL